MGDLSKDFSRHEFRCRCGCGFNTIDWETLSALQELRDYYGQIVTPSSGARCEPYNRAVGGAPDSLHLYARAVDFTVAGVRPAEVQAYLSIKYPDRFGIGRYNTFTHFDTRSGPPARWEG